MKRLLVERVVRVGFLSHLPTHSNRAGMQVAARAFAFILVVAVCGCIPIPFPGQVPTPSPRKEIPRSTLTARSPSATQAPRVSPQTTPKATQTPRASPPSAPKVISSLVPVGQPVQVGNWLFKVTEVQYHKTLQAKGNPVTAEGIFCLVFLDIQNRTANRRFFDEMRWELLDSTGRWHDADVTSFIAAAQFGTDGSPWDNIDPGQSAHIVISFDVPQGGVRGLVLYSRTLQQPFVWLGYVPTGDSTK